MAREEGSMPDVDLRVFYDKAETVAEMADGLVDTDPIELRDLALNLLHDVEALKAVTDILRQQLSDPRALCIGHVDARDLERAEAGCASAMAEAEALKGARLLSVLFGHHEGAPKPFALQRRGGQRELAALGADVAILRDRVGGTTKPLPLALLRQRIGQEPPALDLDDWGGCGCFAAVDALSTGDGA